MEIRIQEMETEQAPRYIEAKLDGYSETMLEGISKNSVDLKWNYDKTEKEPLILPSMIPNILTNLRMSISVSEANKMPSHNINDVCDSIINYIDTKDIKQSIDILKCPDLPSGGSIIYNKRTFQNIYNTGKGSFINIGKYRYDNKKNSIVIYEIPYTTYVENIYDEIEEHFSKFENEVEDFHNGSDRKGIGLELYLKKGANVDLIIQKLRKYTSFENKFSCNFTILDLDGKTPKLCNLENIISMWISHRTKCIKREHYFDLEKINNELHLLTGLKSIIPYLEDIIKIIRSSKNKIIAIDKISKKYNLDESQSKYVVGIQLINLTQDYIENKLKDIEVLDLEKNKIEDTLSKNENIENIIKEQLNFVKNKFGKPRISEIIYEDKKIIIEESDLIEDYNCRILLTNTFIKKHLKQSDNHKVSDEDVILCDITSNNRDSILIFTNLGNRYKIECNKLKTMTPSSFGQPIKDLFDLEHNEKVIKIVSISEEVGYMLFAFENGKVAKVNINKYLGNYTKLKNCYNQESKLISLDYIKKDVDLMCISSEGKALIFDTKQINSTNSKNSKGNVGIKLDESIYLNEAIINVNGEECLKVYTEKEKEKEYDLKACSPNKEKNLFEYFKGNRGSKGNFLFNTRKNNDKVIKLSIM